MAKAAPKKSTEELYAWDAEKRGSGLLLCGVDEALYTKVGWTQPFYLRR